MMCSLVLKFEAMIILILFVYQKEQTTATSLATLPASFQSLAPQATEYCLACVALPPDVSVGKRGEVKIFDFTFHRTIQILLCIVIEVVCSIIVVH